MNENNNSNYYNNDYSMGTKPVQQPMNNQQSAPYYQQSAVQPPIQPTIPASQMPPPMAVNPYFLAGYLQQHIGETMRVEFSLGTSGALTDRTGELMEVGASYIVLKQLMSDDILIADLYSIKFVNIIR